MYLSSSPGAPVEVQGKSREGPGYVFVKPKPTQSRGQNIATNGAEWVETTLPDNLHPVLHSLVVPWPACCWFDNVASPILEVG